jgi:hypothetical protein
MFIGARVFLPSHPVARADRWYDELLASDGLPLLSELVATSGSTRQREARLYKYGWLMRDRSETPLVKTVTTDKNGRFDFESMPGALHACDRLARY